MFCLEQMSGQGGVILQILRPSVTTKCIHTVFTMYISYIYGVNSSLSFLKKKKKRVNIVMSLLNQTIKYTSVVCGGDFNVIESTVGSGSSWLPNLACLALVAPRVYSTT